jgi:hypothetical protein
MAKKKAEQSGENLPAVTLFQIAHELEAVLGKILHQDGELQDGDYEALKTWNAAIEVKAENYCHVMLRLETEAAYFDAIEKRAYDRKMRLKAAYDRIKTTLRDAMQFAGVKSVKKTDGLFSVSLIDGKWSAEVTDHGKLPMEYATIEEVIKPDLKKIKAALDEKKDVPGAQLKQGQSYLQIR